MRKAIGFFCPPWKTDQLDRNTHGAGTASSVLELLVQMHRTLPIIPFVSFTLEYSEARCSMYSTAS